METNALVLTRTVAALDAYSKAVAELYRRKLLERDKYTKLSGKLTNTIRAIVTRDGSGYSVALSLQDYWKYVEGGSKGRFTSPPGAVYPAHWPPTNALLEWIRVKPVAPYPDKNGKLPSERSLAYLIGRKIAFHGIAPAPALAETLEELNGQWLPRIEAAFEADVAAYADELVSLAVEDVTPSPYQG